MANAPQVPAGDVEVKVSSSTAVIAAKLKYRRLGAVRCNPLQEFPCTLNPLGVKSLAICISFGH